MRKLLSKSASKSVSKISTDKLYDELQQYYQGGNALVNGYRLHSYFLYEQQLILELLGSEPDSGLKGNGLEGVGLKKTGLDRMVLDIACGSGLMLTPNVEKGQTVIGVDFNQVACEAAKQNVTHIIRGDAFALPVQTHSFDAVINCQFLNQQLPADVPKFIQECFRVTKPQGKVIIIWRNGSAIIHRIAHALYTLLDKLMHRPNFPVFEHSIKQVSDYAKRAGFKVVEQKVSFPLLRWQSSKLDSFMAKMIGASYVLVLENKE